MSFVKTSELTLTADGNIDHGEGVGIYYPDRTFFYAEDIKVVLAQDPSATLAQLKIISVVFERSDAEVKGGELVGNHNIHKVTGLALQKSESNVVDGSEVPSWHPLVALAWPPYYIRNSVEGLEDDFAGSEFQGERFRGSDNYKTGLPIFRDGNA